MKRVTLNNGIKMPVLGYGAYKVSNDDAAHCVCDAVQVGYRSIDTAVNYHNEEGIGQGIKNCGVSREELFITSKVWNNDHGFASTLKAFDGSLRRLGLDYIDMYLIHWPVPMCKKYVETFKALEKQYADGRVRAIGVSNFTIAHLERLKEECSIVPAVNQIELHPWLTKSALTRYLRSNGIYPEAWSPLCRGRLLADQSLQAIADKHGKTVAQVVLRWAIQQDIIAIPKTTSKARMIENISIFDFELTQQDMNAITGMNKDYHTGSDPDTFSLDANC